MRAMIAETFPDHGIIGEEFEAVHPDAELVWVLDPIDGTRAFITGKPSFGTLIALLKNGRPWLGVIDQPIIGERWIGAAGHGTTLNGKPVRTRDIGDLSAAALYATTPDMFVGEDVATFQRLYDRVKTPRYGADCYAYACWRRASLIWCARPTSSCTTGRPWCPWWKMPAALSPTGLEHR